VPVLPRVRFSEPWGVRRTLGRSSLRTEGELRRGGGRRRWVPCSLSSGWAFGGDVEVGS
jgi:hypothetical protein